MTRRHLYGLLFLSLSIGLFWTPLSRLLQLALEYDHYSHILVMPGISAFLIYWIDRDKIFQKTGYFWKGGTLALGCATALYWFAIQHSSPNVSGYFSLSIFSIVLFWMAGFLLVYGPWAFRSAVFPLFLLLLVVPLPESILQMTIRALQQGSADVSHALFTMVGVPVFRDGFFFTLPGLTVEVAEQCSGIRSSTALFILCLVIGHLFLHSPSRKVALLAAALPVLIFKNAVRIVTISLLSAYVSRDFLTGSLHTSGGVLFFLLGLMILVPILRLLEKSERPQSAGTLEA